MRKRSLALSVGLVAAACTQAAGSPPDTRTDGWDLVFVDEFDSGDLDPARWHTCHWWDNEGCTIASNDELEWYLPEQVEVADGTLILRAEPRTVEASDGETYPYASGMVTTGRDSNDLEVDPRFAFTYGYVEARVSIPDDQGLWPAVWMLAATNESKPEIDIFELYAEPDVMQMHLHWRDEDGESQRVGEASVVDDLGEGFHVIGLEWTPDHLAWFIDGEEQWRVDEQIPDEPMYLVMNLAVGGVAPGPPDDTTAFPAEFVIDWVRVWQQQEGTS